MCTRISNLDGKVDSIRHNDKYNKLVDSCKHHSLVAIEMTEMSMSHYWV